MNISTDIGDVTPDEMAPFGGYEWWYFDGLDRSGALGFVIIFYRNNPFSTRYIKDLDEARDQPRIYPAISVSVYKKGKPVYYSFLEFEEEEFNWDEDGQELTISSNSVRYMLRGDRLALELSLNQELASGHALKGTVRGEGMCTNPNLVHKQESAGKHCWNLLAPASQVTADMRIKGRDGEEEVAFTGMGYFDHNQGAEPMKESFKDWYWGRFHFKSFTLVYYLLQKYDAQQFEGWLIDRKNHKVLEYFEEAKLDYYSRNSFGVKSARKIELKTGQVTVNIQSNHKIDNGPFYQRFISDVIINYNSQVYAAHGISEYILPKNIFKKRYWPLVHMRLRYMNSPPHWVQKSPILYPWTW
jgi:carotenoid 1,2-hydratase